MSSISTDLIKQLRDETGVSVMQCKKALEEANGDMEAARLALRKYSAKAASKKADRELGAGIIRSYIHSNGQLGVLLELNCETDFVAKNEDFLSLADDICLHIVAMSPEYISSEEITAETREKIEAFMQKEVDEMGDKPEDIKAKILEGKVADYFNEKVLLNQAFVKDPNITIAKLVEEGTQKLGEKIAITRFSRYGVLQG